MEDTDINGNRNNERNNDRNNRNWNIIIELPNKYD